VVDFSEVRKHAPKDVSIKTDFYAVIFKKNCRSPIRYGKKKIDFQDGSLFCFAPNQIISFGSDIEITDDMKGWGLFFHPDLIRGSSLGLKMKDYSFFSYEISEALHLSERENQLLFDCILKIRSELTQRTDHYSHLLMVSNIELLLNYCLRYYESKFIMRNSINLNIVSKVEFILSKYYESGNKRKDGMPSVKFLAGHVNLSPGYLSDLLKKETGLNAQDYIHRFVIEQAKNTLLETNQSVSEIAYSLGFEYPQYFSKLFKLKTGKTPLEYRKNHIDSK